MYLIYLFGVNIIIDLFYYELIILIIWFIYKNEVDMILFIIYEYLEKINVKKVLNC